MKIVAYEWDAPQASLLSALSRDLIVVGAAPSDRASDVMARLEARCPVPALLVFHINLSRSEYWPEQREVLIAEAKDRGWLVVNGDLVDITKRSLQRTCRELGLPTVAVTEQTPLDGHFILKTDFNYGGRPERDLSVDIRRFKNVPPLSEIITRAFDYQVGGFHQLAPMALNDPALVLERYVANSRHRYVRTYLAGDAMVVSEAINPETVKKMVPGLDRRNTLTHRDDDEAPPGLSPRAQSIRLSRKLGMKFGTFDFVMDEDGQHFVVDVNACPGWGRERQPDLLGHLASGLRALGPGGGS